MRKFIFTLALLCLIANATTAHARYTKTKNPIVLVHGITGFDNIGGLIDYFHTVPYNLRRSGAKVYTPSLSAYNTSEQRADELVRFLNAQKENKFNLIGHSQGSPTSRIVAALIPEKIASVSSVNGVNGGSKVADLVLGTVTDDLGQSAIASIVNAVGGLINVLAGSNHEQDALAMAHNLSTKGTKKINEVLNNKGISANCRSMNENVNINGHNIKMYSWAGTRPVTNIFDVTDVFLGTTSLAFAGERNDGLVGECATKLGRVISTRYRMNHVDAHNHLFGIRGWTNPVSLYRSHANRLKKSGL